MSSIKLDAYLSPDSIIDSDHPSIIAYAGNLVGHCAKDPVQTAVSLYYAVRDDIAYDSYAVSPHVEAYRASNVLKKGRGFCVQKAALLCALGRSCGIPSRVGFATVCNHLASNQLIEFIGSNRFVFHGYTEFRLKGKWVKATPAFNLSFCKKHKVVPLEFDGKEDSIFQTYNKDKKLFMEYTESHGTFSTVPVEKMISTWRSAYGDNRVNMWFSNTCRSSGKKRDFYTEEPIAS